MEECAAKKYASKEKAYKLLDDVGVSYKKYVHPALFTCEDCKKYNVEREGVVGKNLLLRNTNKSSYYLVIMPTTKRADLRLIQAVLGETKLSFASEEDLLKKLNIYSGAVSLLNVSNVDKVELKIIIDKEMLLADKVGFHPNDNTETLVFDSGAIPKILDFVNADWRTVEY